jgi:predicted nucleic acid-binding protein
VARPQSCRFRCISSLVVDTDVVSFLFKSHPIATQYDADLADHTLIISFMTLAELERSAIQSQWSDARHNWLSLYLKPFVVLPY